MNARGRGNGGDGVAYAIIITIAVFKASKITLRIRFGKLLEGLQFCKGGAVVQELVSPGNPRSQIRLETADDETGSRVKDHDFALGTVDLAGENARKDAGIFRAVAAE